jgi:SPBc2 prophage-derived thioredoxin-like protein yosR
MKKIIKFEKQGCQPCEMVSAVLGEAGVAFEAINPFDQPEMAVKYKIRSVPTVVVLDGETEVERIIGFDAVRLRQLAELV